MGAYVRFALVCGDSGYAELVKAPDDSGAREAPRGGPAAPLAVQTGHSPKSEEWFSAWPAARLQAALTIPG